MARIVGIDLPSQKRIEVALTYIYGIGTSRASQIIRESKVSPDTRVKDLKEEEIESIRKVIESQYVVEGTLKKEVSDNIKRLISIGCYRGARHKKGLPARGQRTRTNARTRKGPSKGAIALKKKKKLGKKG
jgi:small subunit ribosomal protein S13